MGWKRRSKKRITTRSIGPKDYGEEERWGKQCSVEREAKETQLVKGRNDPDQDEKCTGHIDGQPSVCAP